MAKTLFTVRTQIKRSEESLARQQTEEALRLFETECLASWLQIEKVV